MATHFRGSYEERLALDVFIKLNRATDSVNERASRKFTGACLTHGQFGALESLYHLGPMKISDIAAKHLKSKNNFTVIIDNLERAALVRRIDASEDRRVTMVELTEKGRQVIERILPCQVAEIVGTLSILSTEEQETLNGLLRKLGRSLTDSR
ncbi:MAG TPA: MarR family transcriptional regulator [Fimbriimonadaceae bacterium]|nr:MarR family transcriptional regulator [Fimbriimonadaceae bacterium]